MVSLVALVLVLLFAAAPSTPLSTTRATMPHAVADGGCMTRVSGSQPVGLGECPGVRPGALVQIRSGDAASYCTMNFAFVGRTPSGARSRYIGTAGHCVLGEGFLGQEGGGERRWKPGAGPVARRTDGKVIGRVAYAVLKGDSDFALIRLRKGIKMSPRMCTFGGPTGMRADRPSSPVQLQFHGRGLLLGDTVPGRTAVAKGMPHRRHVYAVGAAISGDSGSGVTSADGRAVGVLVAVGVGADTSDSNGADHAGVMFITRIKPVVTRAEDVLGLDLRLLRAAKA